MEIMERIVNLFFELGLMKRIDIEGFKLIGIKDPDSIGSHSLRAAQIGYVLAKLENYGRPEEVASMLVFHDMGECRVGDVNKLANRYLQKNESQAVKDQLFGLNEIGEEIYGLWQQIEEKNTQAGILAKDADLLEQAISAKEFMDRGHLFAVDWINNVEKRLKTESAQRILEAVRETDSDKWWQGLKKVPGVN